MTTGPLRFLISGGARGIGRGLARNLVVAGHDVFLVDRDGTELSHTLETHLPSKVRGLKSHGRFSGAQCDISDPAEVRKAVESCSKWYDSKPLSVLVNNASLTGPYWADGKTIEDIAVDEWKSFVDVNLNGTFYVTQACIPLLKADPATHGVIINVSSTRAKQSEPNHEGYASTKAAMLGLTHAVASSMAPHIRCNAILPGWIPSGQESKEGDEAGTTWDAELTRADQEQHWTGRAGRIEDVAETVLYIARCSFFNGQEIVLDGGMTKKMIYEE